MYDVQAQFGDGVSCFQRFHNRGLVGARPLADDAVTQRRLTAIVTALIQCSVFITAPALLCLLHTCIQKFVFPKSLWPLTTVAV